MAIRFDVSRLRKARPIAGGAVAVPAALTRSGVFLYRDAAGNERRELRPPAEVFALSSLATLAYATVTDLHPDVMVSPENWKSHAVGIVGAEVRQDGDFVAGELVVHDKGAIDRIDKGERQELSCGYEMDLDETPGTFNGERYDAIQRNIRYNHVALGPLHWGRAGGEVALRLDSGAAFADIPTERKPEPKEQQAMKRRFTIDGIDFEIEADEGFFQALSRNLDSAKATVDGLTAERDKAIARADAAEVEKKEQADRFDSAVRSRVAFEQSIDKVLPADYRCDGKTDRDIMIDAIRQGDKTFDPADRSDDYIRARFDMAVQNKAADKSADANKRLDASGKDTEESPLVKAQKQYHADTLTAWQKPLAVTRS